jgi:hypothetical protein
MTRKEESQALAEEWRGHIEVWKSSGQSQSAFCQTNGLSYHRFGYWQRKFNSRSKAGNGSGFVSVSRRAVADTQGLSVVLPRGVVLRGICSENLPVVYQLLSHLS